MVKLRRRSGCAVEYPRSPKVVSDSLGTMFVDEVTLKVESGSGGDGIVHFRREKHVPRGGPDGGDGGKGGDVIIQADEMISTLGHLRGRDHLKASDGGRGGGSNKTGPAGEGLIVRVPVGTLVYDAATGDRLADLVDHDAAYVAARAGRGGKGNARYATSRNQAPRMAEKGEPGEIRTLRLEMRLIADVGIVGAPNAGKSTLLAAISNARPKIADYPFTTLTPNLGVAELDKDAALVVADIPGLVEGAHQGVGLGDSFLKHITRTTVIIHLLDGLAEDPLADFAQINAELALFDPQLGLKPQIVAVNKIDLPMVADRWPELQAQLEQYGVQPKAVSAATGENLRELLFAALHALRAVDQKPEPTEADLPVYGPPVDPDHFEIKRDPDGAWRVEGQAIERAAAMTYWEHDEAVRRFQSLMARIGVEDALRRAGVEHGDSVRIGEYELEWQ